MRPQASRTPFPVVAALMVTLLTFGLATSIFADAGSSLSGSAFNGSDGTLDSNATLVADESGLARSADDAFTGGTSEKDVNVKLDTGSIPPNKSDLTKFYYGTNTVGANVFLYLSWFRSNNIGTVDLDFEFNQATTTFPSQPYKNTPLTLNRTDGDLLVTYDFSGNDTDNPVLGFYKWLNGAWTPAGTDITNNSESSASSDGLFGEAAVNLTGAGLIPTGSCIAFSQAWVKSRSSTNFTNEMKDFIAPGPVNINTCQPSSINVHKQDTSATPIPLSGAQFELWRETSNPANTTLDSGDTLVSSTCTTDVNGDCSFTGITIAGRYYVKETQAPAGYGLPNPVYQAVTVVIDSTGHTYTVTFSDPPLYRLIVFTCNMQGAPVVGNVNLTAQGQVTSLGSLDTDAVLGSGGAQSLAQMVCSTSYTAGANFTNLAAGTYVATVQDPKP